MTPSTIMGIVEDHARVHSRRLDEADQSLYACGDQLLALEHQIAQDLSSIAATRQVTAAQETTRALRERQHAYANLLAQQARAEDAVDQVLAASRSVRANQAQLLAKIDELLAQLVQQREAALNALNANRTDSREILEECEQKLPEFDQDASYAYLRKRQYGTEHYSQRRLVRWMDDWLAKRIDYRLNRENERVLLDMQAHIQTRQAQAEHTVQALGERIEHQREHGLRTAGMPALMAKQSILAHQRLAAHSRAEQAYAELEPFALGEDVWYLDVRQWLTQQLNARPVAQAVTRAINAMNPGDPGMDRLRAFSSRLQALQQQLTNARQRRELARQACDLALTLDDAIREQLFIDVECEQDCNCSCHEDCDCNDCCNGCNCHCHTTCACDYNYDSADRYTDSMDVEHLVAGYMNSDITLDYVLQIIEEQRVDTAIINVTAHQQPLLDTAPNGGRYESQDW